MWWEDLEEIYLFEKYASYNVWIRLDKVNFCTWPIFKRFAF